MPIKLTFENIVAAARSVSPSTAELDKVMQQAPEEKVSELEQCFNDVWSNLRTEFSTEQLAESGAVHLPKIKSNVRKTISNSNLSKAYKELLLKSVENISSSQELLDMVRKYL